MLNIYTGREDIDKQRYMFARIREQDLAAGRRRPIYLVVPDQFTLETERSAFGYMEAPAFINPIVLSMNRLAETVLREAGERSEYLDLYGKYMLLARLLYRSRESLALYRGLEDSTKFISKLSELIMSLKSHLIEPDELSECASVLEAGAAGEILLGKKLHDIAGLYASYEERLADGMPDSTDIMRRFAEVIQGSKLLEDVVVWIYGFDYFSPLHLEALGAMAARAGEVSVILTAEKGNGFFSLTNGMAEALEKAAARAGVQTITKTVSNDAAERGIDCAYKGEDIKPPAIAHIESELFAGPVRPFPGTVPAVSFITAPDYYSEADAAAKEIIRLVTEEGLRYRDILVISNDQERRAAAIQRVFGAYGIETFLDKRREAGYNPVLSYITALPEIISRGMRAEDVLLWVGTGLTDIPEDDVEELENYLTRYKLRGGSWGKPLRYGRGFYGDDTFERIDSTVKYIGDMIGRFSERFGTGPALKGRKDRSALDRTEGLRLFLEEDAGLPERIALYADRLEAEGYLEYAAHMRGVWDASLGIFRQISEALGDLMTSAEEYATILRVGFSSLMMGVLPASSDSVTIGTMQRTRTGQVKAMFVLGANEGELPMFGEDDGLFDDDEKETLSRQGLAELRREESLHHEEQLAIYKNLSKPTRLLWLSYTSFGPDGVTETKPSMIFERLRALFPEIPLVQGNSGDGSPWLGQAICAQDLASGPCDTLGPDQALDPELMRALIPEVLSPTRIEKYSRCPFSFLMDAGLRLKEIRKYEVDSMGIGDVYHEALRRFGEKMNSKGAPAEEDSAWQTATRDDVDTMVDEVFQQMMTAGSVGTGISDEGRLLFEKDNPEVIYRLDRLKSVVMDICRVMTERTRESGAVQMVFEADFGEGKEYEELRIVARDEEADGNGIKPVTAALDVKGRIDRIDVLPGDRAKVVDYKSGSDRFSFEDIRNGWQLQLMIYLLALDTKYIPAGASYFRLFEPSINLSAKKAPQDPGEIEQAILDEYRSDGIAVDFTGPDDENDNAGASGEKTIREDEFNQLLAGVEGRLADMAVAISKGEAPAAPKQKAGSPGMTACTYCDYKSICGYESA